MKGKLKRLIYIFFYYPYFKLYSWRPVWFYITNREARTLYKRERHQLNNTQEKIADDLKKYGIAVSNIEDLFPEADLLVSLQNFLQVSSVNNISTKKDFLTNLWDVEPLIDFKNPYVRLSLDEKVLAIIASYLGMFPKFYYLTLNITKVVEKGLTAVQSQLWHRDPEDRIMCKVFLYLSDVDEKSGPFEYITESHKGGKFGKFFPQTPPRGRLVPTEEIGKVVPPRNIKICTGKAGTLIFCDTSGIHRGGYATEKERIMFTGGYFSKASPWPMRYRCSSEFDKQIIEMGAMAQYAVKESSNNFTSYLLRFKKSF